MQLTLLRYSIPIDIADMQLRPVKVYDVLHWYLN